MKNMLSSAPTDTNSLPQPDPHLTTVDDNQFTSIVPANTTTSDHLLIDTRLTGFLSVEHVTVATDTSQITDFPSIEDPEFPSVDNDPLAVEDPLATVITSTDFPSAEDSDPLATGGDEGPVETVDSLALEDPLATGGDEEPVETLEDPLATDNDPLVTDITSTDFPSAEDSDPLATGGDEEPVETLEDPLAAEDPVETIVDNDTEVIEEEESFAVDDELLAIDEGTEVLEAQEEQDLLTVEEDNGIIAEEDELMAVE